MSPEQIDAKIKEKQAELMEPINKEIAAYNNTKFEGELPQNFQSWFRKAIMASAPKTDDIPSEIVKLWANMPTADFNVAQVGKLCEVITIAPRKEVFKNFDDAIESLSVIEQLYKGLVDKQIAFNIEMDKKKGEVEYTLGRLQFSLVNQTGTVKPQTKKSKSKKNTPALQPV